MDNEKKIYVITAGEYSDYHICAVTTDKERAEFLKKWYFRSNGDVEIEEYTDGEPDVPTTADLVPIYVITCTEKGDINQHFIGRYVERNEMPSPKFGFFRYYQNGQEYFRGELTAEDEEHAIKIVKDKRAKMLAERFGI